MGRVASMEWERLQWVREYDGGEAISEIARRHEVSRKAVHKWIGRYNRYGLEGLKDLSRAPGHHPQAVGAIWHERVIALRQEHPRWGAPKLGRLLENQYGAEDVPSTSTIGRILKEHGLSRGRRGGRPRRAIWPLSEARGPNEVWCIDFKGWRRTGDGCCCQPLTVTDQCTRYLLCCQALPSTRSELVRPVLEAVFRDYGLPQRMRSDNGAPFGDGGQCGLTELAVWWIELGIECERIDAGCPQQNGCHERMHRTLGEATMDPPAHSMRQQQKRFDRFRQEYNHERPHEALGQQFPGAMYQCSSRPYPPRTPQPEYGRRWVLRQVSPRGQVRWNGERLFLSHALAGKQIAFEPVAEGRWRLWYYRHWLGLWEEGKRILRRPQSFTAAEAAEALSSPAGWRA